MLSALTLLALQRHTCLLCEKPLTAQHTYPLIDPGQLLSQTTETGPHHFECAGIRLNAILKRSPDTLADTPYLAALWTVQAAPQAPSGRILRLHDHDPDSTFLHLFSAARIDIHHTLATRPFPRSLRWHLVSRPATYEEFRLWMEPAVADAMHEAPDDQIDDLRRHIATLHQRLTHLDGAPQPPSK
jgi:hypothetical protein